MRQCEGKPASVSYPLFHHFRASLRSISVSAAHRTSSPTIVIDGSDEVAEADLVRDQLQVKQSEIRLRQLLMKLQADRVDALAVRAGESAHQKSDGNAIGVRARWKPRQWCSP